MLFGKYLKICRERYHLTQEELVYRCYSYDDDFQGLDVGTLSRWERGITNPSVDKQIKITKLLQRYENSVFPYLKTYEAREIETELCQVGVKNLIGNSKDHILNFPHSDIMAKNLKLSYIKEYTNKEAILKMPNDVLESLTNNHYELSIEILKSWAKHKHNLFTVSEYDGHFFGMMFVVRLKPNVFEDLLNFKRELKTLKDEDFMQDGEMACSFVITFFAYNHTTASLLFLRYYANLIASQDYLLEVGSITVLESAVKLVEKINLKKHCTDSDPSKNRSSYRATLDEILLREDVFKMLFRKV